MFKQKLLHIASQQLFVLHVFTLQQVALQFITSCTYINCLFLLK